MLARCAHALIDAEPTLTKYDTIVGDGDCGTTMERGAREVLRRLESGAMRLDHPSRLFSDLADAVSASMGGTSGILFELFFRKASASLLSTTGGGGGGRRAGGWDRVRRRRRRLPGGRFRRVLLRRREGRIADDARRPPPRVGGHHCR